MNISLRFLGVGCASQQGLGHAAMSVRIERDSIKEEPLYLLVDCGPGTLNAFREYYQTLPDAVFITHCHLDHIADLESLFFKCWFSNPKKRPKLFIPLPVMPILHRRLADYPGMLAEGGAVFWDAFQLIPVTETFIFAGLHFHLYSARHHGPNSAFSLHLPGYFFYSGDTRPVPEVISHRVNNGEIIFHDACVSGNPSHSGLSDLIAEYTSQQLQRFYVYHYAKPEDRDVFLENNIKTVKTGDTFTFKRPSKLSASVRNSLVVNESVLSVLHRSASE